MRMERRTQEAADRVLLVLQRYLPKGTNERHAILGDFSLVRNWAQAGAISYDKAQDAEDERTLGS